MLFQLTVPGPLEDVEEIRVLEWHYQEGSVIAVGDLLVELETHKALVEIRGRRLGVLRRILCPAGDWAKIGEPLALVSDTADEPVPEGSITELPHFAFEFNLGR